MKDEMTDSAARLQVGMTEAADALRQLAEGVDLRTDELLAILEFLTEVGRADEFVLLSDILGISRIVDDQTHAGTEGTPSNVLGPFYLADAPWITNPGSIVRSHGTGDPLVLFGRVVDHASDQPIAGATIDAWQADGTGRYSSERPDVDAWHLRGRQLTTAAGTYEIETVEPRHYTVKHDGPVGTLLAALGRHPWRPAHIHLRVVARGYRPLVTQVYLAGSPFVGDDAISGVKSELVHEMRRGRIEFDIRVAQDKDGQSRLGRGGDQDGGP